MKPQKNKKVDQWPVRIYALDPVTDEKTIHCEIGSLVDHPFYLESDIDYYKGRGWTLADIKRIWDREWIQVFA